MTGIFIIGNNYEFAKDGREIYDLPEDKKHFQRYITGKNVVVGKQTFTTLPESIKKLPARWIVYNRNITEFVPPNISFITNLSHIPILEPDIEYVCIGGAHVLGELERLGLLDKLVVTKVPQMFPDADLYLSENVIRLMLNKNLVSIEPLSDDPLIRASVWTYEFK